MIRNLEILFTWRRLNMRVIQIDEYNEQTMQLAKPVFDAKGRVLLGAGTQVHPKYLDKLMKIGITYLIVEDAISKGITLDEMVDMPMWIEAVKIIEICFEHARNQTSLPIKELLQTTAALIKEIKERKAVMLVPSTSVAEDMQLYAHSVNVALISLQIGKLLQLNELQLRDLTIGCLLHDIGKAVTSDRQKHPEEGFNILRKIREFNLLSAHIAFQHHEHVNGEGFPRKLGEKEIIDFAQICSVANDYENMISKQGISSYEAMERLMAQSEQQYAHKTIDALFKGVPSYLPGTYVKLNNNQIAIVTKIVSNLHRPYVRLVETNEEFSLEEKTTVLVKEVVSMN